MLHALPLHPTKRYRPAADPFVTVGPTLAEALRSEPQGTLWRWDCVVGPGTRF
jgi:hypothetical protein